MDMDRKASADVGVLTERMFVGCLGLPAVMAAELDRAWVFVGEYPRYFFEEGCRPSLWVLCQSRKCKPQMNWLETSGDVQDSFATIANLDRYLFITDDNLEVFIFFGKCAKCDTVYWARQGPPFSGVSSAVCV